MRIISVGHSGLECMTERQARGGGDMDMVKSDEFIHKVHSFCTDCIQAIAPQYLKIKDALSDNSFANAVGPLMTSLDLTTDDVFFLLENKRLWDVPILVRSILDGSAQCMYLLSASSQEDEDKRLNEYLHVLPKKEWASLEQPLRNMKKGISGCEDEDVLVDVLQQTVQREKTKHGEGAAIKEVSRRWSFWELSRALRRECPQWAASADLFEFRYATGNFMVHKNGIGCQQILEEAHQISTYYNSSLIAYAAPILISIAILMYDRLLLFATRFNLDCRPLHSVMESNVDIFINAIAVEDSAKKVVRKQKEEGRFG